MRKKRRSERERGRGRGREREKAAGGPTQGRFWALKRTNPNNNKQKGKGRRESCWVSDSARDTPLSPLLSSPCELANSHTRTVRSVCFCASLLRLLFPPSLLFPPHSPFPCHTSPLLLRPVAVGNRVRRFAGRKAIPGGVVFLVANDGDQHGHVIRLPTLVQCTVFNALAGVRSV